LAASEPSLNRCGQDEGRPQARRLMSPTKTQRIGFATDAASGLDDEDRPMNGGAI
jgi:hypothetical protein